MLPMPICTVVRAARAANYTWASISAVLGVSKQAAEQRFG